MRQENVAEKINALCIFSHADFVRMKLHPQSRLQKQPTPIFELPKVLRVMVDNDKIVGISDVVFFFQFMLHELV